MESNTTGHFISSLISAWLSKLQDRTHRFLPNYCWNLLMFSSLVILFLLLLMGEIVGQLHIDYGATMGFQCLIKGPLDTWPSRTNHQIQGFMDECSTYRAAPASSSCATSHPYEVSKSVFFLVWLFLVEACCIRHTPSQN